MWIRGDSMFLLGLTSMLTWKWYNNASTDLLSRKSIFPCSFLENGCGGKDNSAYISMDDRFHCKMDGGSYAREYFSKNELSNFYLLIHSLSHLQKRCIHSKLEHIQFGSQCMQQISSIPIAKHMSFAEIWQQNQYHHHPIHIQIPKVLAKILRCREAKKGVPTETSGVS